MISHSNKQWTQAKLNLLSQSISDNFDKVVHYFNLDMRQTSKMYIGRCPIHDGDNVDALNFYHSGHTHRGNWCCNTRACEVIFQPSALGFVRGLLSKVEYEWVQKGDKVCGFMDTINWCMKFLNVNYDNLLVNSASINTDRFISQAHIFTSQRPKAAYTVSRAQIRNKLEIPAKPFLELGFSSATLDKYDVGLCTTPNKPMSERIVFPVYEENGRFMVGCIGRSIWDRCPECKLWHNPETDCPSPEYAPQYAKWRNSADFKSEYWLYNLWEAHTHIKKCGIVILVEGPKDVLRLEDAGIHNSIATFGTKLSPGQKTLLDASGAFTIILLTDPDEAGIVARTTIAESCKNQYNILTPDLGDNDVGATSIDDLQMLLIPLIEQYKIEI